MAHPLRGGAVGALIHLLLHGFGNLLHHGATNGATSLINNRGVFLATLHLNILVGIGLVVGRRILIAQRETSGTFQHRFLNGAGHLVLIGRKHVAEESHRHAYVLRSNLKRGGREQEIVVILDRLVNHHLGDAIANNFTKEVDALRKGVAVAIVHGLFEAVGNVFHDCTLVRPLRRVRHGQHHDGNQQHDQCPKLVAATGSGLLCPIARRRGGLRLRATHRRDGRWWRHRRSSRLVLKKRAQLLHLPSGSPLSHSVGPDQRV